MDLILRRLSSHADRILFASVCRQWHHTAVHYTHHTLPPPLPWLLQLGGGICPQLRSLPDGEFHCFVCLKDHTHSCLGSSGSWLLLKGPEIWPLIKNPLTGAAMQLLNFRSTTFNARKVIVCSPELIAAAVMYNSHRDLVVSYRPGMSPSWSIGLCHNFYNWYQDMAFYEGRIYAVATSGDLFVHEVAEDTNHTVEPRVSWLEKVIQGKNTLDGQPILGHIYLVISCTGKLLMVQRRISTEHNHGLDSGKIFRVFEADFEKSQWLEVESLGDQVLFVSPSCSRAIRASDHGSYLQGSTIYFLHDDAPAGDRFFEPINPPACGVYDMCSKTICPISLGQKHVSGVLKAAWFFP
ncbi:unnamed protein product [Urochloa decumbens]|uniref:KIB1-4 beta-propeller domain-containing protein n=1 Tax=Urochloa decumbens TaxID=240449 RepID=A0ABC9AQF5_9POAL